ncbi:D-3-phosphoglycerate dehydrogenase [Patulibacter medicamentivorans]|jgi:D-3-phosphoglycerate dehydrogenase|uniref:D-3-phosphoglycerate dehydrogenase n=1 Tax=Patulibacter medicamentivorans TaxID=1097667 RepID=H0E238_9ACTN|nr:phosphoglycerate dehydrogenase [Patulibacter medicamentivorans]EHN12248.1 D-3-phosphoglycerate dehydrogenase [Patulibacter medicamentivorans]
MPETPKVLVKEKVGPSGIDALREAGFDVDLGIDWDDETFLAKLPEYDGVLIRSATKFTPELIDKATNLKVVGRAGVGVDNVDIPAATKRGIVVVNAPQSNVVTAAEHTVALMMALARNIPQANASMAAGKWERSKFSGVELYGKTIGIIGFGRIGQLVAERAQGLAMRVLAFDPYVSAERYKELGVEKAADSDEIYAEADFITIHLPKTPETAGWLGTAAFAKVKPGVRVLNVARGGLIDEAALQVALDAGTVAGAALDVFPEEPVSDHPLAGYDNVILTPHLGASTAEANDRAGFQAAEQMVAALTGGTVTSAVNAPAVGREDLEVLRPFLPLSSKLGRVAADLAGGSSIDRIEVEVLGRIAERDVRPLSLAALRGVLEGRTEESVNDVNAPSIAAERGIEIEETTRTQARDFTDLIRVTVVSEGVRHRVVGTTLGRRNRPHLLEAWGQRFNLQLDGHLLILRYSDRPGMVGRIGALLGDAGVNIEQAAVGYDQDDDGGRGEHAVMVITTDGPVAAEVLDRILQQDGFVEGRAVSL